MVNSYLVQISSKHCTTAEPFGEAEFDLINRYNMLAKILLNDACLWGFIVRLQYIFSTDVMSVTSEYERYSKSFMKHP